MSQIIIEDAGWKAIMADPQLARARSKLSFHEIRMIVKHARASGIDTRQSQDGATRLGPKDESPVPSGRRPNTGPHNV